MADNECMVDNSGGAKIEEFSRKNSFEASSVKCKNGIRLNRECDNDFRPCLTIECAVKLTDCVNGNGTGIMNCCPVSKGPPTSALKHQCSGGKGNDADISRFGDLMLVNDENRILSSSMDARNNNNNKHRTLRFDSSESSDSGVAALSNTDSSQSSGTSDITEPCSPPSPASSSPSCTSLPSDRIHIINGYDATSPPSCQGSYDSGLEEATTISLSHSPQTPIRSPEDDREKEDVVDRSVVEDADDDRTRTSSVAVVVVETTANASSSSLDVEVVSSSSRVVVVDHFAPNAAVGNGRLLGRRDWFAMPDTKAESFKDNGKTIRSHFQSQCRNSSSAQTQSETHGALSSASLRPQLPPPRIHHSRRDCGGSGSGTSVCGAAVTGNGAVSDPLMRCHWSKCGHVLSCGGDIVDHIRSCHVDAQVNAESFVCLWEGCKVYNKASCSLSWLERHVLTHSGNKPFKCIVDGCGQRFTSQTILERHVNSHFNHPQPQSSSAAKRKDDTPTKMMKKKRLRYRRTALTGLNNNARKEDFFDSGIMECLRHQLMVFGDQTRLDLDRSGGSITFHSTVIARQVEATGKPRVLLHWVPENIIPDEWVYECQVESRSKQTVSLSNLPRDKLQALHPSSPSIGIRKYRKNRRK